MKSALSSLLVLLTAVDVLHHTLYWRVASHESAFLNSTLVLTLVHNPRLTLVLTLALTLVLSLSPKLVSKSKRVT